MNKNILKSWMDTWPIPDREPFKGETIRADGWVYRDLPRVTRDVFDTLLGIVGEGNIKFMTFADYGDAVRGQVWISPKGMENMEEYNESKTSS